LLLAAVVVAVLFQPETPSGKESRRTRPIGTDDKRKAKKGEKEKTVTDRDATPGPGPASPVDWAALEATKIEMTLPEGFGSCRMVAGEALSSRPRRFLCVEGKRACLLSLHPELRVLAERDLDSPFTGSLVADLDRDGRDEVVICVKAGRTWRIEVLNEGLGAAKAAGKWKDLSFDGKPDTQLAPACTADLDGDGVLEVLARASTGYGGSPRGVWAFEPGEGRTAWGFATGPSVTGILVGDVDGDGSLEIVFGSFSPNNGARAGETDDGRSYVFAVNPDGSRKWIEEIPPADGRSDHIGCRVHLTGASGRGVLVSTYASVKNRPDVGSVALLDGKTGKKKRSYEMGISVSRLFAGADGSIVAVDREGAVHLLDKDLNLLRKTTLGGCVPNSWEVLAVGWSDLNADGREEFLMYVEKEEGAVVAALAPDLESVLWEHEVPFDAVVLPVDVDGDGRMEIVLKHGNRVAVLLFGPR